MVAIEEIMSPLLTNNHWTHEELHNAASMTVELWCMAVTDHSLPYIIIF